MNRLTLAIIGVAALLTLGSLTRALIPVPAVQAETTLLAEKPASSGPRAQATTLKTGTFVAAEHPTAGTVQIVEDNGKRYLELGRNFKSDSGPDLFVILHRDQTLPISGIQEEDYVTLAPLKSTQGNQRYEIPETVDLEAFQSAAIWCRQFNATFGYATLN